MEWLVTVNVLLVAALVMLAVWLIRIRITRESEKQVAAHNVAIDSLVQKVAASAAASAARPSAYDVLMGAARDAVAYAEQQRHKAVKAGGARWDPAAMRDAALHYLRGQMPLTGLTWTDAEMARAVEASLGVRDRRAGV